MALQFSMRESYPNVFPSRPVACWAETYLLLFAGMPLGLPGSLWQSTGVLGTLVVRENSRSHPD